VSEHETAIRAASEDDLDVIVALERASFSDPWSRTAFEALVDRDDILFAVVTAARPERICGYVVAWVVVDEAEIANLAIAPSLRGRGVGGRLLDATIDQLERRGARSIYLEVREGNVAARALYASRRFMEVGRRRRYYRRPVEDALVLRRDGDAQ
jgi:ribosomal-protein-alanine N-acetyltransferase